LRGEKVVIVDSKTPLAPYREACAATDPEQQKRHMKLFARGVKAHVKKLSAKQYADKFLSALDFVVMYLPGDQFYSTAIEHERSLVDEAVKHRVLIATPSTFLGLLRTIAYAWQQEKAAETARDIADHGCTLYERLCVYLRHVDKVSQRMNSLVEAQNQAVGSLERSVLPEARRFPELGAVAADKVLPDTREVTREVRSMQVPEFVEGSARELATGAEEGDGDEENPANSGGARSAEGDPQQEAA
jgi:DNA recombination protein RmuC